MATDAHARRPERPCPVCGGYHPAIDVERGAWQAAGIFTDNKWALVVLYLLARTDTTRYNRLREKIVGITQKMLTQTLRHLERDGLVKREVFPVVPPRVEYALTPLGLSLIGLLENLCVWAAEHYGQIEAARERYDRDAMAARDGAT
jgi:DNA-binding HxlR family transcriptional regulator